MLIWTKTSFRISGHASSVRFWSKEKHPLAHASWAESLRIYHEFKSCGISHIIISWYRAILLLN